MAARRHVIYVDGKFHHVTKNTLRLITHSVMLVTRRTHIIKHEVLRANAKEYA